MASRILSSSDALKEDNNQKFRNTWYVFSDAAVFMALFFILPSCSSWGRKNCFSTTSLICLRVSRFTHDNIVTCSRDGSAIIWIPRSRRSHVSLSFLYALLYNLLGVDDFKLT